MVRHAYQLLSQLRGSQEPLKESSAVENAGHTTGPKSLRTAPIKPLSPAAKQHRGDTEGGGPSVLGPEPALAHFPVPESWDQGIDTDRQKRTAHVSLGCSLASRPTEPSSNEHRGAGVPARRSAGPLKRARGEKEAKRKATRHVRNGASRWKRVGNGARVKEEAAHQNGRANWKLRLKPPTPAPCSLGRTRSAPRSRCWPQGKSARGSQRRGSGVFRPTPPTLCVISPPSVSDYEIGVAHCDCSPGPESKSGAHADTLSACSLADRAQKRLGRVTSCAAKGEGQQCHHASPIETE
jgi:hypothetical protein